VEAAYFSAMLMPQTLSTLQKKGSTDGKPLPVHELFLHLSQKSKGFFIPKFAKYAMVSNKHVLPLRPCLMVPKNNSP